MKTTVQRLRLFSTWAAVFIKPQSAFLLISVYFLIFRLYRAAGLPAFGEY